jgi:hypothetical protein
VARPGTRYPFNAAGQVIDVANLLCLFDSLGPCGNPVKDSQRTKTGPETRRTLSLIWGTSALPGRSFAAETWYRQLLAPYAREIADVQLQTNLSEEQA